MNFKDFYYIKLLGRHKHHFKRLGDKTVNLGERGLVIYAIQICLECGKTLALDDWQMNDLPSEMAYSKIKSLSPRI